MNKVKFIRDESNQAICHMYEDGKWVSWKNSQIWSASQKSPNFFVGLDKKHGFRAFQLALKAGYEFIEETK